MQNELTPKKELLPRKQYIEGVLPECKKHLCERSCCDDGEVMEWINEYFALHERIKEHLIFKGIKIKLLKIE